MTIIKTPWYTLSQYALFVLFLLLPMAIIFFFLDLGTAPALFNGLVWVTISIIFRTIGYVKERSLEKIKNEGNCYNASVVRIVPYSWMKVGSYITATVECSYLTGSGEKVVKSGLHLLTALDRLENLSAKVYACGDDMDRFGIEVFRG